jgi:predicted anti-sigma-YlaC factor YlaD
VNRTPQPPSTCAAVREALSSRLDGEDHPVPLPDVHSHLSACGPCTRFESQLAGVTRRTRVATAEPVPDLTAPILVALAEDRASATDRRTLELRWLVALAGAVQLVLAVPALVGLIGPDAHLGRDLGALQLALGVGLLFAAWQPRRSPGVLPIAAVVAIAAMVTAGIDVATGVATLTAELTHLSEVIGVLALWALRRRIPDEPRPLPSLAG